MTADDEVILFSERIRQRERRRQRLGFVWLLISCAVHVVLVGLVILLTPIRDVLFEEKTEEPKVDKTPIEEQEMQQIVETMEESRMEELLKEIRDMQTALHNIDLMKEELAKDYDAFVDRSVASAQEDLSELIDQVESAQSKAIDAQSAVRPAIDEITRLETEEDLRQKEVAESLLAKKETFEKETSEQTSSSQALAVNQLHRLQAAAALVGYEKTLQAAETFRKAQEEVGRTQNSAQQKLIDTADSLRQVQHYEDWINRHETEAAKADERKAEQERQKADYQQKKVALEQQKAEHERTLQELAAKDDKDSKNKAKAEKRSADTVQRQINDTQRRIDNAQRQIDREIARANSERAQAERDRATQASHVKRRDEVVNGEQQKAFDRAAKDQRELHDHLETLRLALAADQAKTEKLAQAENRQENALVTKEAKQLKMAEAYELARQLEVEVAESFKDIKAIELAMSRRMSFQEAEKLTSVVKPKRRDDFTSENLERKVETDAVLLEREKLQHAVVHEARKMSENAKETVEKAMEIVLPKAAAAAQQEQSAKRELTWLEEADLADRQSAEAVQERLAEQQAATMFALNLDAAAAESSTEKAKDIADLMKSPEELAAQRAAAGNASDGNGQPRPNAEPPPLVQYKTTIVPGNVMLTDPTKRRLAEPADWMYVNSWHVIGPYPNPDRVNLHVKFPPESKVDLDAKYVGAGKGNETLEWAYEQAQNRFPPDRGWMADWRPEVMPVKGQEYAIFYAYAEVFFDQACDRWIAIGSDDRSDIWINDMKVWGSSDKLKSWKVDEGFRRVHFRKGRNRILVRIENGWHGFGWSLCISTSDEKGSFE